MIHYPYDLEFISYDGKFPNLCRGKLLIRLHGQQWGLRLKSGGVARSYGDNVEHIVQGPWQLEEDLLPDDFPRDLIPAVLLLVEKRVPRGCCAGCL